MSGRRSRPERKPGAPAGSWAAWLGRDPFDFVASFRHTPRALRLLWTTAPGLALAFAFLSVFTGLLPAAVAWTGKLIVDGVVAAIDGDVAARQVVVRWLLVELALVVALAGAQRALVVAGSLLRAVLGHRVNEMILEKALSLHLEHFEDPETYDRLTRSRREASFRPVSLAQRIFQLVQAAVTLTGYGALLVTFSPWAVALLVVLAFPSFVVAVKFNKEAFRLYNWHTPERRRQVYLESVMARLDYAKEVALNGLGPHLLARYREIFHRVFDDDRRLALRRGAWAFVLGIVSSLGFYAVFAWIVLETMAGKLTLGQMTMYLAVFKQGQGTFAGALENLSALYGDNLYVSNLYEFLEVPVPAWDGTATEGPSPGDGVRFEGVRFSYPGSEEEALAGVDLHVPPGQKLAIVGDNGSGKTTLIKLLTRLYDPTQGRVLLDGLDLKDWDVAAVRRRFAVIFQDFARYQFVAGENIGAGDVEAFEDREAWQRAARRGMAAETIEGLPEGYDTQLGRWFQGGRELSGGQWQKVALSRAFMREDADILVLDEPTAAMDAEAEAQVFDRFRALTDRQLAILISHRFSTVRMADRIVVLAGGAVKEDGTHDALMSADGLYAKLFTMQAQGYL